MAIKAKFNMLTWKWLAQWADHVAPWHHRAESLATVAPSCTERVLNWFSVLSKSNLRISQRRVPVWLGASVQMWQQHLCWKVKVAGGYQDAGGQVDIFGLFMVSDGIAYVNRSWFNPRRFMSFCAFIKVKIIKQLWSQAGMRSPSLPSLLFYHKYCKINRSQNIYAKIMASNIIKYYYSLFLKLFLAGEWVVNSKVAVNF